MSVEVWIYANGIFCFQVSGGVSLYVCVHARMGNCTRWERDGRGRGYPGNT